MEAPPITYAACRTCGATFAPFRSSLFGQEIVQLHCNECAEKRQADCDRMSAQPPEAPDRVAEWDALCPHEYRLDSEGGATIYARLSRECPAVERIAAHSGRKGLLVRGDTGKGKTRALWRLLRRHFDQHNTVAAVTGGEFSREFQDAAGNHRRKEWFDRMAGADAFFLDDLGRCPWTENVWGEFFELIEDRAKNDRPTYITTNEDGASLGRKCKDPVTWGPLYRRLREHFENITV